MEEKTIKIVFQTYDSSNALTWDEYEEKVINAVMSEEKPSFNVFLKYPMPTIEMNNVVRELCDRLHYKYNCVVSYTHGDECMHKEYKDVLTSIVYHIQLSRNEVDI